MVGENMTFWIQANCPRFNGKFDNDDETLCEAIETVFPLRTEDALLVWKGAGKRLGYKYDLSVMLIDILNMIEKLNVSNKGKLSIHWPSNTFPEIWDMDWCDNLLRIKTKLNFVNEQEVETRIDQANSEITIEKDAFIYEWKYVLMIIINALKSSGYNGENLPEFKRLIYIENSIQELGVLYRT